MKLKICGVQSVRDARRLADLGVDFVGLNFVPDSPRRIELPTARAVAAELDGSGTTVVALFQDQPLELVRQYAAELQPDFVQLHGRENAAYLAQLDVPIIKAIPVGPDDAAADVLARIESVEAAYYLLDRRKRGEGQAIVSALAAKVVRRYPQNIFLAGGLHAENLPEILQTVQPFAVDIAGGVRTDGVLDFAKVQAVLEIVRSAP